MLLNHGKKIILFLLISTLTIYHGYSQNKYLDSVNKYDRTYHTFKTRLNRNVDTARTALIKADQLCKDTCQHNYVIYALYGCLYYKLADYDKAEFNFTKSLSIKPNQKYILLERSQLYYTTKLWAKAMIDVNKALSIDDQLPDAYYYKAQILGYGYSKIDSSELYINKAIQIDPENLLYLKYKFKIFCERKQYDEAEQQLIKICELEGLTDENIILGAELALQRGLIENALNILISANKKHESAALTARIAYMYAQKRDYTSSLDYLERLVEIDPTNADAFDDLTRLKFMLDMKKQAIYDLKYRTAKVNNKAQIYSLLSDFYFEEAKYDSSLFYINKAITTNTSVELLSKRAKIYQTKQDLPLAYKDYKTILKTDSCNLNALYFTASYELSTKDFKSSTVSALKGIDCGYKSQLTEILVQAYFYQGDFTKVNATIDSWLKYDQKNTQALFIKSIMKAIDGDLDRSFTLCRMAINYSDPKDEVFLMNLRILEAMIYLAQKNYSYFYTSMDKLVTYDKNIVRRSFIKETAETAGNSYKIKMNHLSGFDFYLSITLPEEIIKDIHKRYDIK